MNYQDFAAELNGSNGLPRLGLVLMAQMGNTPAELVLVARIADLNQETGELIPIHTYTVKIAALVEHQLTLGPFEHVAQLDDHPILYAHNHTPVKIYVGAPADDPMEILNELAAAHNQLFGRYRPFEAGLNHRVNPLQILTEGMGALGEYPEPFAIHVAQILMSHGVPSTLAGGDPKIGGFKLLAFDDSYFVARIIQFDLLEE
jgi:hypothetical protein